MCFFALIATFIIGSMVLLASIDLCEAWPSFVEASRFMVHYFCVSVVYDLHDEYANNHHLSIANVLTSVPLITGSCQHARMYVV